jgi:hypothetical protein
MTKSDIFQYIHITIHSFTVKSTKLHILADLGFQTNKLENLRTESLWPYKKNADLRLWPNNKFAGLHYTVYPLQLNKYEF